MGGELYPCVGVIVTKLRQKRSTSAAVIRAAWVREGVFFISTSRDCQCQRLRVARGWIARRSGSMPGEAWTGGTKNDEV